MRNSSPYEMADPADRSLEDPLRLRLDFHEETVMMHVYKDGGLNAVKRVSVRDAADALARLDTCTGILPEGTLWRRHTSTGAAVAVWRSPQVWTAQLRTKFGEEPRRFRLPMPGLVFITAPARRWVFAAKARPQGPDDQLYRCPAFNVFRDGGVCVGSHQFPSEPEKLPEEFFRSHFAAGHTGQGLSRKHPDDVGSLWEELDGSKQYPLHDLVPAITIADAMRLGE